MENNHLIELNVVKVGKGFGIDVGGKVSINLIDKLLLNSKVFGIIDYFATTTDNDTFRVDPVLSNYADTKFEISNSPMHLTFKELSSLTLICTK